MSAAEARGWERACSRAVMARLRADGVPEVGLEVNPENTPAVRLYERFGFETVTTYRYMRLPIHLRRQARVRAASRARGEDLYEVPPGADQPCKGGSWGRRETARVRRRRAPAHQFEPHALLTLAYRTIVIALHGSIARSAGARGLLTANPRSHNP